MCRHGDPVRGTSSSPPVRTGGRADPREGSAPLARCAGRTLPLALPRAYGPLCRGDGRRPPRGRRPGGVNGLRGRSAGRRGEGPSGRGDLSAFVAGAEGRARAAVPLDDPTASDGYRPLGRYVLNHSLLSH
ncbi:phosphatase [Streptomyces nanhaiensis]|uniref:phosphatase n=1 Tax=Streptomyces nanhaiensis TaxID=679319 RepID=UPI00399CFE3D